MRKFIAIYCMLLCCLSVFALDKYASTEISNICSMLHNYKAPLAHEIYYTYDADSVVTNVGYKLFNKEIDAKINKDILNFIERYTLQISLLNFQERNLRLKDDKVELDSRMLWLINDSTNFRSNYSNKRYTFEWEKQGNVVCTMSFPGNYNLISGYNIIESDSVFRHELLQFTDTNIANTYTVIDTIYYELDSTIIVDKGDLYNNNKFINSNKYFRFTSDTSSIEPALDIQLPETYVSSLFYLLTHENYNLDIIQMCYGYNSVSYQTTLQQFSAFCINAGCKPYIGIESIDGESIKAVIVYVNDTLNYNHLLVANIPYKALENKCGSFNCTLYTYIPTYNKN